MQRLHWEDQAAESTEAGHKDSLPVWGGGGWWELYAKLPGSSGKDKVFWSCVLALESLPPILFPDRIKAWDVLLSANDDQEYDVAFCYFIRRPLPRLHG